MAQGNDRDLIELLLADHAQVEQLLGRLEGAVGAARAEWFCELTNELVRHEVAEEEILYPEVRRALPDGDQLADARIAEQSRAEELLDELEKLDADDPQFVAGSTRLRTAVLAHAKSEEQTVFEPLGLALDAERRLQLGSRYEKAKAGAPTHPHPHAPDTPPGNLLLGPVAALIDRTRDAVHKAAS